jgi:hypothetical protein
MATKLTLSINSKVIESAKIYSRKKGTSLSKLIEDYLVKITKSNQSKDKKRSITELRGIGGSVPDDFDYEKAKTDYLLGKHFQK